MCEQQGITAVDLSEVTPDPEVLKVIPPEVAVRYKLLPLSREGGRLTVAMADPLDAEALGLAKMYAAGRVERRYAPGKDVVEAIAGTTAAP